MTAEIVVMNREAVAMAADSAVTVGSKIYQSANKLFTLNKLYPVGIMISNAANFMGVPWETIVKMYRQLMLGESERSTIEEYCLHFLNSINNKKLCTKEQQEEQVSSIVRDHLAKVLDDARQEWHGKLLAHGRCSRRQRAQILKDYLSDYEAYLQSLPDYPFKNLTAAGLSKLYKAQLESSVEAALKSFDPSRALKAIALRCAKLAVLKNTSSRLSSTVAIAGFGGDEVFPALQVVEIDGVIADELKVTSQDGSEINRRGSYSFIRALAQSEMVERFMEGVEGTYQVRIEDWFQDFCESIGMTSAQAQAVVGKFRQDMAAFRHRMFSSPITSTLVHLPKLDMAKMAEALVSLTSLKRRVSDELETVADPIDVAVISKGDGFIWIKRKHYFSPELNPHFATHYFRENKL